MKPPFFKRLNPVIVVLSIALLAAIVYIFASHSGTKTGVNFLDQNLAQDITVDCSQIESKALSNKLTVKVHNNSSQTLHGIAVRIIAFDENGNELKTKIKTLDQTLLPNSTISRTVHFSKKTKTCKCVLETATTQY
jgi:hypothetical protein